MMLDVTAVFLKPAWNVFGAEAAAPLPSKLRFLPSQTSTPSKHHAVREQRNYAYKSSTQIFPRASQIGNYSHYYDARAFKTLFASYSGSRGVAPAPLEFGRL